jgi:hypothetical protein
MAYIEAPANFYQGLARLSPCDRLLSLMRGELELAAEPNAPGLRPLAALIGLASRSAYRVFPALTRRVDEEILEDVVAVASGKRATTT